MSKKKNRGSTALPEKQPTGIALAAGWPVLEVLVSRDWDRDETIATVLIARQSPKTGRVGVGSFLVDLRCLGIKQAQVHLIKDAREYAEGFRAHIMEHQPMMSADFNLAVKIVLTGLAYAEQLGFRPDPVYAQAQHVLVGAAPDASPVDVRTGGPEGKPFFINGPYDDTQKIIDHLTRTLGPDNFHYLIRGSAHDPGMSDLADD
jgi:hypothetical protein